LDILLICLAILLTVIGLAGCIVPGLPGPPLNFIALLMLQWAIEPFSGTFLLIAAVAVLIVSVLDFLLPVWIAKKFGASREGMIGSIIGMFLGMVFPPVGIIFGLVAGAVIGDMIAGKSIGDAVYSGFGNALGTLFSTGFKLMVSGFLTYYLLKEVFSYFAG